SVMITAGTSLNHCRLSHDHTVNYRGKSVVECLEPMGFTFITGRSRSKLPSQLTFTNKNGCSVVDLIWVNSSSLHLVKDMWVDDLVTSLDHFPVTIEWTSEKKKQYKHLMAWSAQVTGDFKQIDSNQLCANLYSAINEIAGKCQMMKTVSKN
ncbi:hypothetical protein KQX54_000165, partial [Cotesia glomerata]